MSSQQDFDDDDYEFTASEDSSEMSPLSVSSQLEEMNQNLTFLYQQRLKSQLTDEQLKQYQSLQQTSLLFAYLSGNAKDALYTPDKKDLKWNGYFNKLSYPTMPIKQEPLDFSMATSVFHSANEDNQNISAFLLGDKQKQSKMMERECEPEEGTSKEVNKNSLLMQQIKQEPNTSIPNVSTLVKKNGRKKQQLFDNKYEFINTEDGIKQVKQEKITEKFKPKKKIDRFDGMSEEDVMKRTLPDHLIPGLDILIIGINPGLIAAFKGHHYAGPGNHFWKCLFLAGLIPEPMTALDDYKLLNYGIGFTNIVARTTRGSSDLTRKEIKEGAEVLLKKLQKFQPKIAVFNGKLIYEVFSGRKTFDFGRQPEPVLGTKVTIFVMPSSSARCAQLPRAVDKVPFYVALKKLRDHLCGLLPHLDFTEVSFPDLKLKVDVKKEPFEFEAEIDMSANPDFLSENSVFHLGNKQEKKKKSSNSANPKESGRKKQKTSQKTSSEASHKESWNSLLHSAVNNWQQAPNKAKATATTISNSLDDSIHCSSANFPNNYNASPYFSPDNKTYFPINFALSSMVNKAHFQNNIKSEPYDPDFDDY
ncbi:uncharacterized protein Tdg [Centruroides vittatus]|uniref:uncharacterized protein Tdg n=1 Tax=Centruroides vittatus TaxID=120091 RepID=UPI00350FD982